MYKISHSVVTQRLWPKVAPTWIEMFALNSSHVEELLLVGPKFHKSKNEGLSFVHLAAGRPFRFR